jgi:hypothetical protein
MRTRDDIIPNYPLDLVIPFSLSRFSSLAQRHTATIPLHLSLMHHFCPENITTAVSIFRPDGEVPVLNKQHWDGGQCRIFKVDFLNGESWSIRFPVHIQSDSQDTIINLLQGEQSVLQELNKRKFPWSPEHYGSSLTFENCVGFPFMALSWIDGSPLPWTMTHPPRPVRDEVLRQIAEIQMALINCTKEDRTYKYSHKLLSSINSRRWSRYAVLLSTKQEQIRPSQHW